MDSTNELYISLVKWLQTLELKKAIENPEELSDGVLVAQSLVQIAPNHFKRLQSIIHSEVGTNWRLRIINLKKIVKCLEEYYQDVLNLHLMDSAKPDITKIGENNDIKELGKLLCLVLGCAVNCDSKQEYITCIMAMEESVQQNIMQAIQLLEEVTQGRGRSSLSLVGLESEVRLQRLLSDLEAAVETKELLSQKCHTLEAQVACLTEDKISLTVENSKLMNKVRELALATTSSEGEGAVRNTELRRQIDSLKEDLYKTETQRDDYRFKMLELDKEILMLQDRLSELQSAAEKAAQLKDEVDALTETVEKVKTLETTIASYKKKLEEYSDIKKKCKALKEENDEYYRQNLKYEEELKRANVFKSQSELYKKQVTELHQKLDEEMCKTDKMTIESKKLESKLVAVQREKECLMEERDGLKEMLDELRCQQQQRHDENKPVASELAPTELQARVRDLEKEVQSLRANAEDNIAKQLLLDDALLRVDRMQEQNRNLNQRVLELEAGLEEAGRVPDLHTDESSMYKQKCALLQEALTAKEAELNTTRDKYSKNLGKAKDIIKHLEQDKQQQQQQQETPARTPPLQPQGTQAPDTTNQEDRLLATYFYQLALDSQRDAIDEKIAQLSASHGQSFLSRQRQPMPRRTTTQHRSK